MIGGFVRGIVGAVCTAGAVILFFLLIGAGATPGTAFVIAGGVWVVGWYLTYVSRHTVKTR